MRVRCGTCGHIRRSSTKDCPKCSDGEPEHNHFTKQAEWACGECDWDPFGVGGAE